MKTEFWNDRYGRSEYAYGEAPNIFFAEQLSKLNPGKLFLPAEGEGRNAVFAAQQGWQIDAVDYSDEGRNKAINLALRRGVADRLKYDVLDLNEADLGSQQYDAIGVIYMHLSPELRKSVFTKLAEALKPGGTLIAELFHPQQIDRKSGGPPVPEMMYTPAQLEALLPGFTFQILGKATIQLQEGYYHDGEAVVTRASATKPE